MVLADFLQGGILPLPWNLSNSGQTIKGGVNSSLFGMSRLSTSIGSVEANLNAYLTQSMTSYGQTMKVSVFIHLNLSSTHSLTTAGWKALMECEENWKQEPRF